MNRRRGSFLAKMGRLFGRRSRRQTVSGGKRASLALVLAALVVVFLWAALEVRRRVEGSQRYSLERWQLELGEFPDWVTPEIHEDILGVELWEPGELGSVFRGGVLARLRRKLEVCPWVREVGELRLVWRTRESAGAIEARLVLRVPVAVVPAGDLYYLTDAEGLRVGGAYREDPSSWFRVPLILGFQESVDVPAEGYPWTAADVLEGVSVARVLHEAGILQTYLDRPIEAIDVSNVRGRRDPPLSEVVLYSTGQALEWGRSPRAQGSRVLSLADKLEHLRRTLDDPESLGYSRIALYAPKLVGVRR